MEKRAFLLILTLLMLCSAIAEAAYVLEPAKFSVKIEAVKSKIIDPVKESAEFKITIKNEGEIRDTYKILYLEDPKWSFQALPDPINREITLNPGEEGVIQILVKGNVKSGLYGIKTSIESLKTHNIVDDVMRITVGKSAAKAPPAPDFDVDVSVPAQMDPSSAYTISVNIKNNNERLLEGVDIKLSGDIVNEHTNVTVNPNESKSISFSVILMDSVKPQQSQLHVVASYNNKVFYEGDHNFEVVPYLPPYKTEITVAKKFLREDRTIKITNDGNTLKSDDVRIETSLKEKFFSRAVPKFTTVKEGSKYYFVWPASLDAGQSIEIKLRTSYRLLLFFAIVLIALLAYKIATSNPIIVKKKVIGLHKHGGAIADFAVVVKLRNRGKEKVSNIRVVDRVSRMVKLKHDSFEGSMHPVKLHSHAGEGTLLEYKFGEISPGDERVIKYKVYSALNIFGVLTLKPAIVEFVTKKGAKRKSKSNSVSVNAEEPPKEEGRKPKNNVMNLRTYK